MDNDPPWVDYTKLLPENLDTPLWHDLFDAFSQVANPIIHSPRNTLAQIRDINVDSYFASLNTQMLGLKVPILSFTPDEYKRLMRWLGTFIQTAEASTQFINFLSFIKNVPLIYVPLWASDITDITTLTDTPGTSILLGGAYFPTPYYDIYYPLDLAPNLSSPNLVSLLQVMQPIHLVLRNVIAIEQYEQDMMLVPVALDIMHDTSSVNDTIVFHSRANLAKPVAKIQIGFGRGLTIISNPLVKPIANINITEKTALQITTTLTKPTITANLVDKTTIRIINNLLAKPSITANLTEKIQIGAIATLNKPSLVSSLIYKLTIAITQDKPRSYLIGGKLGQLTETGRRSYLIPGTGLIQETQSPRLTLPKPSIRMILSA